MKFKRVRFCNRCHVRLTGSEIIDVKYRFSSLKIKICGFRILCSKCYLKML